MATPTATTARDERLHRTLTENARRVERAEREYERALDDRRALWQRAAADGWTQARIASAARTTEGAVTQTLRRARIKQS